MIIYANKRLCSILFPALDHLHVSTSLWNTGSTLGQRSGIMKGTPGDGGGEVSPFMAPPVSKLLLLHLRSHLGSQFLEEFDK